MNCLSLIRGEISERPGYFFEQLEFRRRKFVLEQGRQGVRLTRSRFRIDEDGLRRKAVHRSLGSTVVVNGCVENYAPYVVIGIFFG